MPKKQTNKQDLAAAMPPGHFRMILKLIQKRIRENMGLEPGEVDDGSSFKRQAASFKQQATSNKPQATSGKQQA